MSINRLLAIILFLSNRGKKTAEELAEKFEVSKRTIYRDVDKLSQAGIPICSDEGRNGGYFLLEDYKIDNLYFKEREMGTVLSYMKTLGELFDDNPYVNQVLHKYEERGGQEKININLTHLSMKEYTKVILKKSCQAIDHKRVISFYYTNRRKEMEYREIEPVYVSLNAGSWFINGFCRKRKDYRQFKISRITNMKVLDEGFENEISMEELKKKFSEDYNRTSVEVLLKFHPKMEEHLKEDFEMSCIKKEEDGYFMVKEKFPYDEGLLKFILGFGKWCEIVKPEKLKVDFKEYLKEMMKKY